MDDCYRCGRTLNRHGACINLFCGRADGAIVFTTEPASPHPRARVARTRPRRIWRGVDGGQSVVVLQVMGEMWGSWQRWGDAP